MDQLIGIDWKTMFVPGVPILEIVARGTIVYLFLFVILRILKREAGAIGIADLLLVVLIADAVQNAMASEYRSVTDGLVLVGTIALWNYTLDWLGYKFPVFERLLRPGPLPLVKDGQVLRRNMRRELITVDELMSHIREEGAENLSDVKAAYMEADGRISVIMRGKRGLT